MTYKFSPVIKVEKVRDGDGFRTRRTVTVTITDDTDPDFKPFTKSVSGYPVTQADSLAMGEELVIKFNKELAARKVLSDELAAEDVALGGMETKIIAYLSQNVEVQNG